MGSDSRIYHFETNPLTRVCFGTKIVKRNGDDIIWSKSCLYTAGGFGVWEDMPGPSAVTAVTTLTAPQVYASSCKKYGWTDK